MKIQKTLYHTKLQEYLDYIQSNEVSSLDIPIEVKAMQVGILPHLLLVFMTAERLYGISTINIATHSDEDIDRFCDSYYGFIVLSTFWRTAKFNFSSRDVTRTELYSNNKKFHHKLINLSELKMGEAIIPFFDHLPIEKGLFQLFYDFDKFKSESELESPLVAILKSISRNKKREIYPKISPVIDPLMGLSWELLGNTHNHARTNADDTVILSPNLRGLQYKILSMGYDNLIKYSKNDEAMKNYYKKVLNGSKIGMFLELTFFDSGPGVVKRFLGEGYKESLSALEEANALSLAMEKGNSSAIGHLKSNKGFGLDRVLRTLSEKEGFLKIRSGSLNVYRDLIDLPYSKGTKLLDSHFLKSNKFKKDSYLEGTLISLIIPILEIHG